MNFAGRVGFVTGASRGIGREIATQLAKHGASVAVASRNAAEAEETAATLLSFGVKSRGYACDVSSFEESERVSQAILHEFGALDFLVNNAGVTRDRLILRMRPGGREGIMKLFILAALAVILALSCLLGCSDSSRLRDVVDPEGNPDEPGDLSVDFFDDETVRWIDYAPTGFDPTLEVYPSAASIRLDLEVIREAYFRGIVTYSSEGTLRLIPEIAGTG